MGPRGPNAQHREYAQQYCIISIKLAKDWNLKIQPLNTKDKFYVYMTEMLIIATMSIILQSDQIKMLYNLNLHKVILQMGLL